MEERGKRARERLANKQSNKANNVSDHGHGPAHAMKKEHCFKSYLGVETSGLLLCERSCWVGPPSSVSCANSDWLRVIDKKRIHILHKNDK